MLATYYRGRTTFGELMNMPLSYIHYLYKLAEKQAKSKEGQEQKAAEVLEDEMEAAVV